MKRLDWKIFLTLCVAVLGILVIFHRSTHVIDIQNDRQKQYQEFLREIVREEVMNFLNGSTLSLETSLNSKQIVHKKLKFRKLSVQTPNSPSMAKRSEKVQKKSPGHHLKEKLYRQKYIVYLCDSQRACAGWGDRQRGVVAAFLLANVTNRKFVINMTSPCSLSKFLIPNEVDWDVNASKVKGMSSRTVGGVRAKAFHKIIRESDFNNHYPEDIVYLRTNADLISGIKSNPYYKNRIPAWADKPRHEAFKNGWTILMKPSEFMQKRLDRLLAESLSKDGDLVCAHVRIGKNPSVPNDSPNRNDISTVPKLWDFLQPYADKASHVFVATDSSQVRLLSRKRFGEKYLDSGGKIVHIDRQRKRSDACEGFETVILEQLILTKCHVLVCSASNFSIRGAFLRGTNRNLYIFRKGKVVPFRMN